MEESCRQCGRTDVDDAWLWMDLARMDPDVDCEDQRIELLPFCSQAHAAAWLAVAELEWEEDEPGADTTSGKWLGTLFFLIGLGAIVLSFVGAVAIALWIL